MFLDIIGKVARRRKKEIIIPCLSACLILSLLWVSSQIVTVDVLHTEKLSQVIVSNSLDAPEKSGNATDTKTKLVTEKSFLKDDAVAVVGTSQNGTDTGKVVILMWSKYYAVKGDTLMQMIMKGKQWDSGCCTDTEITLDRSRLEEATAVVIFNYFGNLDRKDLPKTRRSDQLWVLFGKESPVHSPRLGKYDGLFNWTMSYRLDSDISAPYGEYVKLEEPLHEIDVNGVPIDKFISKKSKLLTAVISHCKTHSKREEYLDYLKKNASTPVDVYGNCGKHICPRTNTKCNHTKYWNDLASKYKFYFAAENAICVDYITEKFWRALEIGMVPVTYGGGNYTKAAPPGSFIDSRDFSSPKKLAEYLKKLDNDVKEYRKYFEWRKRYTVRMGEAWQGWCSLCSAVLKFRKTLERDPTVLKQISHTYRDLGKWWAYMPKLSKKDACSKPYINN